MAEDIMDIQRSEKVKRNRRIRRILYLILTFAVIGGATVGLSKLKPAPPSVESATVVSGEVKRGQMIRNVHGIGTLVPKRFAGLPRPSTAASRSATSSPATPSKR